MDLLTPKKPALNSQPPASSCFNRQIIESFNKQDFTCQQPFPWYNFKSLLTEDTFNRLYAEFPSLDFFEKHEGIARNYGQRPHNRCYLAYEKTVYTTLERQPERGVIRHEQLSLTWQSFMSALLTDLSYHQFICDLLGVSNFTTRYAWHIATTGHSVSPHVDSSNKAGTHIFYFNTSHDWKKDWGGSTLILGGKDYKGMNPEISDFGMVETVEVMDNRSFLFKNQPDAWHAVDTISCPSGTHRRIFNVIFEIPKQNRAKRKLSGDQQIPTPSEP